MDKFKVRQVRWIGNQRYHEGHNRAEVHEGTLVWAIRHEEYKSFFYYAYLTKEEAEATVEVLLERDIVSVETNFRKFPGCVVIKRRGLKGE